MNQYTYDGPVMEFETCVTNRWHGSTYAVSEQKARSNLAYQFKKRIILSRVQELHFLANLS
jgi:hypothetical protein